MSFRDTISRTDIRTIIRFLTFICGLLVLSTGFVNVDGRLTKWCDEDTATLECIGPYLFWNVGTTEFITESNGLSRWRSVFSFQPSIFINIWITALFGFILSMQHFRQTRSDSLNKWSALGWFHVFTAVFACFGYVGNLGIICGFFCSGCAFLHFLMHFVEPDSPVGLFG